MLVTLPEAFDIAVIDRIYNYIPGWEIPKIDDSAYNNNYGLITDYLSEALHYLFTHDSEYFALVNKFLKIGDNVEGRDNRALQKTVLGMMKLIYPTGEPTPEEFDEIVEYALEGRRRVKEQLNKRKPDEEYAHINLSYINRFGEKVVVYCPESKYSVATQNPRKQEGIDILQEETHKPSPSAVQSDPQTAVQPQVIAIPSSAEIDEIVAARTPQPKLLKEQTVSIMFGDTGYSYDNLFKDYLEGAREVTIQEPHVTNKYQMNNFLRFCETVAKVGDCKKLSLRTKIEETPEEIIPIQDNLQKIKDALADAGIDFEFTFVPKEDCHDRFITLSNGWRITLGRGLHIYQNINQTSFFTLGTYDQELKPCLGCAIDFKKIE